MTALHFTWLLSMAPSAVWSTYCRLILKVLTLLINIRCSVMKLTIGTINWLHPKSVFLMESLAALLSLFDVFELPPLLSVFFPRGSLSDENWYLFWTSLTHGHDRAVKSLPYSPCLSDALADQLRFSEKLPTYPSPKPSFCPKWGVIVNVSLGVGEVGSLTEN